MRLTTTWYGTDHPFQGDLALVLAAVPADAVVSAATVTVTPRSADPGRPFEERFVFGVPEAPTDLPAGDWGLLRAPVSLDGFRGIDVDLHDRRTLVRVEGAGLTNAHLTVYLGGIAVAINKQGGIRAPGDDPFQWKPGGDLPPQTVSRFSLTKPATAPAMAVNRVTVRSLPSNVTVRVGGLGPVLTRIGDLASALTGPDIAAVLQAALARAPGANGVAAVPLVVHSDTLCRLEVRVDVEYDRRLSLLPSGLPEATLSFDYSALPKTPSPLRARLPAGATVSPSGSAGTVTGAFEATRIAFEATAGSTVDTLADTLAVPVSAGVSQAQLVGVPAAVVASGLDLLLAATTAQAALRVTLVADLGGKPFGTPLADPLTVRLSQPAHGERTWVSTPFPAPVRIDPLTRCWLAVQALDGAAEWGAVPGPGLLSSADGGFSWRAASADGATGPVTGVFRLRGVPDGFRMPVQLRVGGESVSLERFEPLGRVDVDLSAPEVSRAIAAAGDAAAGTACPAGETLSNGDFRRWRSVGTALGQPSWLATEGWLSAVAMAPNGARVYATTMLGDAGRVEALDLACAGTATVIPVGSAVDAIAVHPDGFRVVTAGRTFVVVDQAAAVSIGDPVEVPGAWVQALAFGPAGGRLYALVQTSDGDQASVAGYDPVALEDAAVSGGSAADAERVTLTLDQDVRPVGLAVAAPDPQTTVVAALGTAGSGSRLVLAGADLGTPTARVNLPGEAVDLAVTPDGRRIVVVAPSAQGGTATIVDTGTGAVVGTVTLAGRPVAVVVDPSGRVHTVSRDGAVRSIDLAGGVEIDPNVSVGVGEFVDLLATPGGDALLVASRPVADGVPGVGVIVRGDYSETLAVVPLGTALPEDWTLTSGTLRPVCVPPAGRAVVIGNPSEEGRPRTGPSSPAGLSQVVAVRAGCEYDMAFLGLAMASDCLAEVIWRGPDCHGTRTDTVAIRQLTRGNAERLVLHRRRLAAADGATQAELRFLAPAGATAAIAQVSLAGTGDALADADLRAVTDAVAGTAADTQGGWSASPSSTLVLTPRDEFTTVANPASGTTSFLEQEVEVTPSDLVTIEAVARLVGTATAAPALTVGWLTGTGTAAGDPIVLTIRDRDLDVHRAEATVPAGAGRARLRLTVPPDTAFAVTRLSMRAVAPVDVPVTFLAQAPGELTVIGAELRYDIVPVPAAPPAAGLCPATPPGRLPGEPPDDECQCPICGAEGSVARQCAVCDPPRAVSPVLPALRFFAGRTPRPALPRVAGIGLARTKRLVSLGLGTADRLASTDPRVIRQLLPGLPHEVAAALVEASKRAVG